MEIAGSALGFISIPRTGPSPRPPGDSFSGVVVSQQGPGTWVLRVDGRSWSVISTVDLYPGQLLRLKRDPDDPTRWIVQKQALVETPAPSSNFSPLSTAFLARGLPLVQERLAGWQRWANHRGGPSDKEFWAASLESRGQGPQDPVSDHLQPWLAWQALLEKGEAPEPPSDEEFWDLWNSRRASSGDPWLVQVVHWEFEGRRDSGLLQAHFHPQRQAIDRWNFTAAPEGVPFRLEAAGHSDRLDLILLFFRKKDLDWWGSSPIDWASALSGEGLKVAFTARLAGTPPPVERGSVDVTV